MAKWDGQNKSTYMFWFLTYLVESKKMFDEI